MLLLGCTCIVQNYHVLTVRTRVLKEATAPLHSLHAHSYLMGRALHAYNMCAEIIIKLNFSWLMGPGEIVGSFIFLGTKFVRVKGPRSNRLFPCRRCRLVKSWYNLELLNLPICLKALRHGDTQHHSHHRRTSPNLH